MSVQPTEREWDGGQGLEEKVGAPGSTEGGGIQHTMEDNGKFGRTFCKAVAASRS